MISRHAFGTALLLLFLHLGSALALTRAESDSPTARGVVLELASRKSQRKLVTAHVHDALGTMVVYQSPRRPFTVVLPVLERFQEDRTYLAALCARYRKRPEVRRCELNFHQTMHDDATSVPHGAERPTTPAEGAKVKRPKATKPICPLTADFKRERLMKGTLSPFWAQEYIGADLVQALVADDLKKGKFKVPKIGILDHGFIPKRMNVGKDANKPADPDKEEVGDPFSAIKHHHGVLSANIVNGAEPVGVAPMVPFHSMFPVGDMTDWLKFAEHVLDENDEIEPDKVDKIYNISMALGFDSDIVMDLLRKVSEHSILVVASGNDWPKALDRNETLVSSLMVGSLYPHGYISHDSSEGKNLDIVAPSDNLLTSSIGGHEFSPFGGTSGAAPLVTGTLSLVMGYLPDLDVEEARLLLKGTAVLTSNHFQNPQKNGPGMLNTLKAVAVAKALAGKGKAERLQLLKSAAHTGAFNFQEPSAKAYADGVTLLELPDVAANCAKRKEGLDLVRKSFLLQPNEPARAKLVEVFEGQGLSLNAEFYQNLDKTSLLGNLEKDAKSPNVGLRQSVARTASYLPEAFPIAAQLISDVTSPTTMEGFPVGTRYTPTQTAAVLSLVAELSPAQLRKLVSDLSRSPDPQKRATAALAAVKLDIGAMQFISAALKDSDPEVKKAGLTALRYVPGDQKKLEYFSMFSADKSPETAETAAMLGAEIGNEDMRAVAKEGMLDSKIPAVKAVGIRLLTREEGPKLAELIKSESDPKVVSAILGKGMEIPHKENLVEVAFQSATPGVRLLAVGYSAIESANSADIGVLRAAVFDPDKEVRQAAAMHLVGLGIAVPQTFDRFKRLDRDSLSKLSVQTVSALIELWSEKKQLQALWTRADSIAWFRQYLAHSELSADQKQSLVELIAAAEAARKKAGG